ncbi:replicative DNA helicase [Neisseria sp. Ec49-e6-T10]|uniref:replicative DNA helicase n=1 Tax=Neisseria sp. Ec49-e6-T10 TaxID=3140744 RepID=UPI003EBB0712
MITNYNTDAERALIGGLLINNNALDKIIEIVDAKMFYDLQLSKIFQCVTSLIDEHNRADILMVNEKLGDDIAPLFFLADIHQNTPSAANIVMYAKLVKKHFQKREAIRINNEVNQELCEEVIEDVQAIILDGAAKLEKLTEDHNDAENTLNANELSLLSINTMMQRQEGVETGLKTGYLDFDNKTNGLNPGNLVIVAGRPSMGKTLVATNIMQHVALNNHVLMFSLEMSKQELADRQIASLSGVELDKIIKGKLTDLDYDNVTAAAHKSGKMNLTVDFRGGLTIEQVRAKARMVNRKNKLGLIVVDYLQLMNTAKSMESKTVEVGHISKGLKALAKELNVPVIALSQLSRSVEQRTDKRPIMSDLRDSGSIEQDADVIVMVYREEYYNDNSRNKGIVELIIRKNRQGETGSVFLAFQGNCARISNLSHEWTYQEPVEYKKTGTHGF